MTTRAKVVRELWLVEDALNLCVARACSAIPCGDHALIVD
jgi:hypothetical protein